MFFNTRTSPAPFAVHPINRHLWTPRIVRTAGPRSSQNGLVKGNIHGEKPCFDTTNWSACCIFLRSFMNCPFPDVLEALNILKWTKIICFMLPFVHFSIKYSEMLQFLWIEAHWLCSSLGWSWRLSFLNLPCLKRLFWHFNVFVACIP